jgi:hypothetical protein
MGKKDRWGYLQYSYSPHPHAQPCSPQHALAAVIQLHSSREQALGNQQPPLLGLQPGHHQATILSVHIPAQSINPFIFT